MRFLVYRTTIYFLGNMDDMEVEYCEETSPVQETNERGVKRAWIEKNAEEEVKRER